MAGAATPLGSHMRGCFVTGTDTGAGKTVVAAAIVAALRARQVPVRALKPVLTGVDEPASLNWPPDHVMLANAAGSTPREVAPFVYGPAVSPHLAAHLSSRPVEPPSLVAVARASSKVLVVEGVGGLLVPLTDDYTVRDLARALSLPLVVAARPGLGTINHTLLTLEAARGAGLEVAGVVFTPWPESPGLIERSNRETVERLGQVPVAVLPTFERAEVGALASAGAGLPLDEWLSVRAAPAAVGY